MSDRCVHCLMVQSAGKRARSGKECRINLISENSLIAQLLAMSDEKTPDFMNTPGDERGLVVEESKPELKKPPLYQVVLLNDDYTPMDFVVEVLEQIFGMDRQKATRIMLEVHTKGKGRCGVFTYEIAETKVAQVGSYAQQHQHPLMSTLEEA